MQRIFGCILFLSFVCSYAFSFAQDLPTPPIQPTLDTPTVELSSVQEPPDQATGTDTDQQTTPSDLSAPPDALSDDDSVTLPPNNSSLSIPTPDAPAHTSDDNGTASTLPTESTTNPHAISTRSTSVKEPLADVPTALLNEILPDPLLGNEFIELHNVTDHDIDLTGWHMCDLSTYNSTTQSCDTLKSSTYIFPLTVLHPHDYLLIYGKINFAFVLNNTDEKIFLTNSAGQVMDTYTYKNSHKGRSWNYNTPQWYEEDPTPQTQNIPNPLTRDYPEIIINELLPQPASDPQENEFIEIYNPLAQDVSIDHWRLKDASISGVFTFSSTSFSPCRSLPDRCLIVPANGYLVVFRSDFSFALNDSESETVSLIAPNNKIISSLSYDYARPLLSFNHGTQLPYTAEPTPGMENMPDPRTQTYTPLLLTEVLPNPSGDEKTAEYIEIYNPHDEPTDLKNWLLHDASSSGAYVFTTSAIIAPHTYYVIYRSAYGFALNNSDETVSLIAPNDQVMSTISYATAREDVSYNFDLAQHQWRWSKHQTPGKENVFNNLPVITHNDIPTIGYKDVYTAFDARATDADRDQLHVRWDFGDGHKSYIWKTRHKYMEAGIYHGSLRIQDDSEEIVQYFTIVIKRYPRIRIKITKIVPNPTGKDTDTEYFILYNEEKSDVDLKGWSIATGSTEKTIVNHPINQKTIVKKSKTKVMTHRYAAITLPNTSGVVEIRRPDGSVADHVRYGDGKMTIADNASYDLTNGIWQWTIPADSAKKQQAETVVLRAIENEALLSRMHMERIIAYNKIHSTKNAHPEVRSHEVTFHSSWFVHFLQITNEHLFTYMIFAREKIIVLTHMFIAESHRYNVMSIAQEHDRCMFAPATFSSASYDFCPKPSHKD